MSYLKRVIVTPAVYPRLVEFLHFDIQSTVGRDIGEGYSLLDVCFLYNEVLSKLFRDTYLGRNHIASTPSLAFAMLCFN